MQFRYKIASFRFKFLNENLNIFTWPKTDDIDFVEKEFILTGPLNFGNYPFKLNHMDFVAIQQKYKEFKNDINISNV